MCGIVGSIIKGSTGFTKKTEDTFVEMLYADAVRGFDSTGIIAVDKWGGLSIMKEATQAAEFIPKMKEHAVFKDMWFNGKVLVGHNRKKTIGEIKDETAHPFTVDKTFAMVHNGTLTSYWQLDKEAKTDSQALATVLHRALEADNHIDALEIELGSVNGAYALVFFCKKRNTVFLLRNKERPLWLIETDDAYFFASEPLMAGWIASRNGYEYAKLKIKAIEEHVLYAFDCDTNKWKESVIEPKKAVKVVTTTAVKTTSPGTTTVAGKEVNKAAFKYLKRKYIGTKTYFWVSDHVEEEYPKTIEQGATSVLVFANDDDIRWRHDITTTVDMAEHGMLTEDELYAVKWVGTISNIEYSDTSNGMIITVSNAVPVPKAPGLAVRALWIQGLSMKSLINLELDLKNNQYKYAEWQIEALISEIEKRKQEVKDLQEAMNKGFKNHENSATVH